MRSSLRLQLVIFQRCACIVAIGIGGKLGKGGELGKGVKGFVGEKGRGIGREVRNTLSAHRQSPLPRTPLIAAHADILGGSVSTCAFFAEYSTPGMRPYQELRRRGGREAEQGLVRRGGGRVWHHYYC